MGNLLKVLRTQVDPLNVVARSHDIALWSRVSGYQLAYLDHLLYHARHFFDYGGCLCIYSMTELAFWRLHMKRREQEGRWADFAATHRALLDEVRTQLPGTYPFASGGSTNNRGSESPQG